ncbi:polyketide synthase [Trametopsis cervina]|nr:polyketide synthase [Trametopsis cervina]
MSPARIVETPNDKPAFPDLGLYVVGVAPCYPERHNPQKEGLRNYATKMYPMTPALDKVLAIADNAGIDYRACAFENDSDFLTSPEPPTLARQRELYLTVGVGLTVNAARKAIAEWGGSPAEITHIVGVSSTTFSNPGMDYFVAQALGLRPDVERVLLHGVGCAGGLAGLRTAAQLACAATLLRRPARVLIVACELGTVSLRTELDIITKTQEVHIPVALFADAGSALILSNTVGAEPHKPVYELLGWEQTTVPETGGDITFDITPGGWHAGLTHRVPKIASTALPPAFASLTSRLPASSPAAPTDASEYDWAIHPGGAKVLLDAQKVMGLTPEHTRASWDVYRRHGNTSSATIFSVLSRLREPEMGKGRSHVLACAFGPGVVVEGCVLRRCELGGDSGSEDEGTAAQ